MVRFKNRYIVVEVNPTRTPTRAKFSLKPSSLHHSIIDKLEQLHGDFGVASTRSGFLVKYCNEHTRVGYIRVRHGPHRLVVSALPLINQVENIAATIKTLYTGASLLQCNKFLRNYQQRQLQKIWTHLKTDSERQTMQEAYNNFKQ